MKISILGAVVALLICASALRVQGDRYDDIAMNQNGTLISRKPAAMDAVRYVSPNGNDSNDGFSPGTAKLTWDAACQALPGGGASPPTCGRGRIKVMGKVAASSASSTYGRWLMGSLDPNYASPPAGWYHYSGMIVTQCVTGALAGPHGHSGNCTVSGGSRNTPGLPGLWLSGISSGFEDDQITISDYVLSPVRIGICSNGDRNGTCGSNGIWLNGISNNFGNCPRGGGPGIDIGSNVFWLYVDAPTVSGCFGEDYALTSLSRSSSVVTAVTSTTNDIAVGMWITVNNASDSSFNGSFRVTAVSGSPQTAIQWAQSGADTTAKGAVLFSEKSAAVAIDPGTGGGSGNIFIHHAVFSAGGFWMTGNSQIVLDNTMMEGNGTKPTPPVVTIVGAGGTAQSYISSIDPSDGPAYQPAVEVDGACLPDAAVIINSFPVTGCGIVFGTNPQNFAGQVRSPLRNRQYGIEGGHVYGQTNVVARIFPPTAVRYSNLVQEFVPSSWTYASGSGVITAGISAPDGTTNAGQATSASGTSTVKFYTSLNTPIKVGDIWGFVVWVRSQTANGYAGGQAVRFNLTSSGYGAGDACTVDSVSSPTNGFLGDGEWDRLVGICKVASNPTRAGIALTGAVDTTHTAQFYAPTLIKIPAGTLSDNEAWELINDLIPYPPSCSVGTICGLTASEVLPGLSVMSGNFAATLSPIKLTANRMYTFPDNSATIAQTIARGTATLPAPAISAGACATVVTVPAANVTTSDSISWAFNAAPGRGWPSLTIQSYPTVNYVNFLVCNPSARSVTPAAVMLNWIVIR